MCFKGKSELALYLVPYTFTDEICFIESAKYFAPGVSDPVIIVTETVIIKSITVSASCGYLM